MISIVAVGKKHEDWIAKGLVRYEKRLRAPFDVRWQLLSHSSLQEQAARQEESTRMLERLGDGDFVVLLDEQGASYDSPALAEVLQRQHIHSKSVTFVIGGAYGVDARVHERANLVLSLSKLVFPHQLVRLILIEQLYRAQEITRGGRYHHE